MKTEQPGLDDRLPVWCGRKGDSYKESDVFGLSSRREELLPRRSAEPTHEHCQCPKLCPVDPILQIHPEIFFFKHLVYLLLSLRIISQLLALWIPYFSLCKHTCLIDTGSPMAGEFFSVFPP